MNIFEKIEKATTKNTLHRVRMILIKEFHEEYYENVANISSKIELCHEKRKDSEDNDYFHYANMFIWQNGMISFSNIGNQTPAQRLKIKKRQ